ncbi:hypothetical protein [Streptomyces sp. CSDS2]|uniref:hypothetical protein n=1 Tax=Streptomyces sp. CSDS2 TaxID=3055051 RepID=UPI0025AF7CAD|nr:hypothetical protein [Streptomyces sp. CSDS2]
MRSVTSIGGPTVAGLAGAPAALWASAAGMAASGLLALTVRTREARPVPGRVPRLGRQIGEGVRFVLGHPVLRGRPRRASRW